MSPAGVLFAPLLEACAFFPDTWEGVLPDVVLPVFFPEDVELAPATAPVLAAFGAPDVPEAGPDAASRLPSAPDCAGPVPGALSVTITGTSVGTGARLAPATAKATVDTLRTAVMTIAILTVRFNTHTRSFWAI
jgi:hypothetical protein